MLTSQIEIKDIHEQGVMSKQHRLTNNEANLVKIVT